MAEEVSQCIENALNKIVSTMEESGNMKKILKNQILETVSTLRNLFVDMRRKLVERTGQNV